MNTSISLTRNSENVPWNENYVIQEYMEKVSIWYLFEEIITLSHFLLSTTIYYLVLMACLILKLHYLIKHRHIRYIENMLFLWNKNGIIFNINFIIVTASTYWWIKIRSSNLCPGDFVWSIEDISIWWWFGMLVYSNKCLKYA